MSEQKKDILGHFAVHDGKQYDLDHNGYLTDPTKAAEFVSKDQYDLLAKELAEVKAEHETLARFGEWLGTDMSGCYDAQDAVNLWKGEVDELKNQLAEVTRERDAIGKRLDWQLKEGFRVTEMCDALRAQAEKLATALDFYGQGKVDHEPDIPEIKMGGRPPFQVSKYYGHVARETLKEYEAWKREGK